jgi:hypothetical protein
MMVLAAARLPSSRNVSASSAVRSTVGSLRQPTGSDLLRPVQDLRGRAARVGWAVGLKACWYNAVRNSR